jgi:cytidine deaminase
MGLKANNHAEKDAAIAAELERGATNTSGFSSQDTVITREIDRCLAPCTQCTGVYVDNIRGDILRIVCRHQCHFNKPTVNLTQEDFDTCDSGHTECNPPRL